MGKNKQQGTTWESDIVRRARLRHLESDRYPLRGVSGEPDLYITTGDFRHPNVRIPVVAWKRLVPAKGSVRRVPDGERDVVVLTLDDFLWMVEKLDHLSTHSYEFAVQAKATERLNVTRVLASVRKAVQSIWSTQ